MSGYFDDMKVRTKILIGFTVLALIIILSFLLFLQIKARRDSLLVRYYQKEHDARVINALRTGEHQLKTLIRDYSVWDEMVTFAKHPDTNWSKSSLSTLTATYRLEALWVFNKEKNLLYAGSHLPESINLSSLITDSLFQFLIKNKTACYFSNQLSAVYEFAAGTIRPTSDTLMVEQPSGFFIVARAINEPALKHLEDLSGSSIIVLPSLKSSMPAEYPSELGTIVPLTSWDHKTVCYLDFRKEQPLLISYMEITLITSLFYFSFALLLLLLTAFALYRWIYLPLEQITKSLALENTDTIKPLSEKRDEFGQIAFMIERFFLQKKELAQIIHEKNDLLTSFTDAESKNTAILSAIPDHLFRINLFGIISDFHINNQEDFPLFNPDMIGKNIEEVLPHSVSPFLREAIVDVNKTGQSQSFDFSVLMPNGHRKYYDTTLTQTRMGDYLAVIRNITTRKEAEMALQRMLQKEGELNRLKTQFISTVSHEFRTPLSAISSNTQLLEMYDEKWSAEKKMTVFVRIHEAVNQLLAFLNNLSLVAKDQSGKFRLNPSEFNLEALCQGIINDNVLIFKSNVDVKMTYSLPVKLVQMDKELVRYIISNLISNALKFSPHGSVVSFDVYGAPGNHMEFSIEDQGVGIPEKDMPSIFEPFQRGENATDYQGTGLGLSIVKRCVDTHLGSITIDSIQGKGTRVKVLLPIIEIKPVRL